MNKKQLIALWAGIIIISLMGIFPPWIMEGNNSGVQVYSLAKYHCILTRPYSGGEQSTLSVHHIDIPKLIIQWFIVGLICTGLVITFHKTE